MEFEDKLATLAAKLHKRGQIYLNPHLLPASQTSHANSAFPEAG